MQKHFPYLLAGAGSSRSAMFVLIWAHAAVVSLAARPAPLPGAWAWPKSPQLFVRLLLANLLPSAHRGENGVVGGNRAGALDGCGSVSPLTNQTRPPGARVEQIPCSFTEISTMKQPKRTLPRPTRLPHGHTLSLIQPDAARAIDFYKH